MNTFQPMDMEVLQAALQHFEVVAKIMTGVIGTILVIRFVALVIQIAPVEAYGQVLKSVVIYLVVMAVFPEVLRIFLDFMAGLSKEISIKGHPETNGIFYDFLSTFQEGFSFLTFPRELQELGVLYLAQAIYGVLLSLLIAIGPVVLFFAIFLDGPGLASYFASLFLLSSWPLMWNLIGALAAQILAKSAGTSFSGFIFFFVISALQLCSPLFSVFLFKGLSMGSALAKPVKVLMMAKGFKK